MGMSTELSKIKLAVNHLGRSSRRGPGLGGCGGLIKLGSTESVWAGQWLVNGTRDVFLAENANKG